MNPPRPGEDTLRFATRTLGITVVLVLAALLRFSGLGWGLRHRPHLDERYFVENVGWMVASGDLDHRFYEYPGLFFYILAPVLAFFSPPEMGAPAYLAARAVVAAFSLANVALVYALGRRFGLGDAALAGAVLLAVSPVEIHTAHQVRPDVALETFSLLALLAFWRLGPELRGDLLAGAALGAAAAVKFTGALLAPSYLAARAAAPGGRWWRPLAAAAAALVTFALCSPYYVVNLGAAVSGVRTQVGHHYVPREAQDTYLEMAGTYVLILGQAIGVLGAVLAAAGAVVAVRRDRRFWAVLLLPVVTIAVFASQETNRDRHLVPALGAACLLAAVAVAALAARSRGAAAAVVALALALPVPVLRAPLPGAVSYVSGIRAPLTADRALDWIEASVPPGALIVSTMPDLGLDPRRYELFPLERDAASRLRARHAAAAVVHAGALTEFPELRAVARFDPANPHVGPPLAVARAVTPPAYRALPLRAEWIRPSRNPEGAPALVDGDADTSWRTPDPQEPGDALSITLPGEEPLARVELVLSRRGRDFARALHVQVPGPEGTWRRVPAVSLRPEPDEQAEVGERAQVLVFEPVRTRALRVVQHGRRGKPWGVAELRLLARDE